MESLQAENGQSRRSGVEMMFDVLAVISDGTYKPTHIAYRSNLSWNTLNKCLKYLIKNGLLHESSKSKRHRYELTEKGFEVLQLYRKVRRGLGISRSEDSVTSPGTEMIRELLLS